MQTTKMKCSTSSRKRSSSRNPNGRLERIMSTKVDDDRIEVSTTYEHLARRIGEAVNSAYKGEITLQYAEGEKLVRVHWRRD